MAYTLNTSHPLYGNLIELFGVDTGALVSLKTARTFTKHADASYVTGGTYGEAFRSVAGGFTAKGASFTPTLSINATTTTDFTLFVVTNNVNSAGGGGSRALVTGTSQATIGLGTTGLAGAYSAGSLIYASAVDVDATPAVLTLTRNASSSILYSESTQIASGGAAGVNGTQTYNYLLGQAGAASVTADLVWMAWFDKALSQAEIASLISSLGANNAFGLVDAPGGGGDTVTCTQGTATALGLAASVLAATFISCSVGGATASGHQSSVSTSTTTTIVCSVGSAAASGLPASVISTGSGTITTEVWKNNTGTPLTSLTVPKLAALKLSDMTLAASWTGQTTNGSGIMTLVSIGLVAATDYLLVASNADGSSAGVKKYTAT